MCTDAEIAKDFLTIFKDSAIYLIFNPAILDQPKWCILLRSNEFSKKKIQILTESTICNDYLDEVYPDEKLNPTDPYEKAKQRILLERWGKVKI